MYDYYFSYGSTTGIINSLETDDDIKKFLSKYKHWYIKERHLSKHEAEMQIKKDISFLLSKFVIKDNLVQKFNTILGLSV